MSFQLLLSLPFALQGADFVSPNRPVEVELVGPTFRFADFDGDGLDDVYAVDPRGGDVLFRNRGDGSFEDVTATHGLGGLTGSRMALWFDFDRDDALDLYVAKSDGSGRLFQNTGGGQFVDVTAVSGIAHQGGEWFAEILDFDSDAWPDLHIVTDHGDVLFHNIGRGAFERVDLPRSGGLVTELALPIDPLVDAATDTDAQPSDTMSDIAARRRANRIRSRAAFGSWLSTLSAATSAGTATVPTSGSGGPSALIACRPGIQDIATMGCVDVSSTPTLGALYPLSTNLNVSAGGNVGIGTTTPNDKLDINGSLGVDNGDLNTGTDAANALRFGAGSTGEAIGSRRSVGGNFGGLDFYTAHLNRIAVTNGGKVGIGTTTPDTREHVFNGSAGTVSAGPNTVLTIENNSNSYVSVLSPDASERGVIFGEPSNNAAGGIIYNTASVPDGLELRTNGNVNRMTIAGTGNVGIGTTAPGTKLDVVGDIRTSTQLISSVATGTAPLSISSTTKVPNLNADMLDNLDSSAFTQLGQTIETSEITDGTLGMVDIGQSGAASGQVIKWSGSAWAPAADNTGVSSQWTTNGSSIYYNAGKVGVGIASPSATLHVDGVDGLLATGTYGSGTIPASGGGTRLMWYPNKFAFRAGAVFSSQWDDTNIGDGSVAMGESTMASGQRSFAMGAGTTASGDLSTATGYVTTASGDYSTAMGYYASAAGLASTAMGNETRADTFLGVALGRFNVGGGAASLWVVTDPLFEIGNGTASNARANALTVLKNGNTGFGTTTPEARVHALANSAGAVTADGFSVMVAENNSNCFLSLISPDAFERGILFGEPSNSAAGGIVYNNAANPDGLQLRTNGNATRMIIDGAGKVGIGRTPTANRLEVEGEISKTTAGICAANSDRRIKTEIHELDDALDTLDRIRPVAFHYTDEYMAAHPVIEDKEYYNVIAQEFAEVFPDYVHDSGENGILQVDTYPALIHAIAAVKELHGTVKEQHVEIAQLSDRLARLESALAQITVADRREH